MLANKLNPEVDVDPTKKDPLIVEQVNQLRAITNMINNATLGTGNVAWVNLQSKYHLDFSLAGLFSFCFANSDNFPSFSGFF